jgi:hypothetical protein
VRGRRGQPVGRPPAPDRAGAAQRTGVRDDTLRHVPSGHAAPVRPTFQCRATGLGRREVLHQTGVEFVRPGNGQAAAGHRRVARNGLERRVETFAVAVGRDELCARAAVPDASVQLQLFKERQQQSVGNEVGQKQLGKRSIPVTERYNILYGRLVYLLIVIIIRVMYVLQLLQLPDSKLVKSRGSWPGPGLNSMRTLESVCPEISRSEQYLSPPVHDREYGLAKKQSCSSETSNGTWI